MSTIKLNDAARKRVEEYIEAERAVGDPQSATDVEMLLKLHDETHDPQMGKRETAEGRVRRIVDALNIAITLLPGHRIVSHGTRVEVRSSGGHYHDAGLDAVAEFHKAFDAHIAVEPGVPEYGTTAGDRLRMYAGLMAALGENLKRDAAAALEAGDEGGGLLLIRLQLCQEELGELAEAMVEGNIVGCLDALTDMTYVADGTYLTLGLGHYKAAAREEVHASNMSKLGEDGKPIISDAGRVVKGPNYQSPNLRAVLGLPEEEFE